MLASSCAGGPYSYNIEFDLSKDGSCDTFLFDSEANIVGVDLNVSSELSGCYTLTFHDGDAYAVTRTFRDSVDTTFRMDWYTNMLIVKYSPCRKKIRKGVVYVGCSPIAL